MVRVLIGVGLLAGCSDPGDVPAGDTGSPATTTATSTTVETSSGGTGSGEVHTDTGALETGSSSTGATYPVGPYGIEVGDVIAPMSFVDENGDEVSTAEAFGAPQRAFVLFGTAAW